MEGGNKQIRNEKIFILRLAKREFDCLQILSHNTSLISSAHAEPVEFCYHLMKDSCCSFDTLMKA